MTNKKNSSKGYTLIQMAIALMVVGILVGAAAQIYANYKTKSDYLTTYNRIENVVQRLYAYKQATGVFPCPSGLSLPRTGTPPGYGQVSNCADTVSIPNGTCSGGICIRTTTRDTNPDPALTTTETLRVRVGGIPFRDLQIEEKDTFDAYGSRLQYAVTENMANMLTYNEKKGAINILDGQGRPLTPEGGSGSFFVLSTGPNKVGGYAAFTGAQSSACPAVVAGIFDESLNCTDMAALNPEATFVNNFTSLGTGGQYDDMMQYFSTAENKLWRRVSMTGAGSENITDLSPLNVGIGNFTGVGSDIPDQVLTIRQSTVNPTNGNMMTTNDNSGKSGGLRAAFIWSRSVICTFDGSKCFSYRDFFDRSGASPLNNCDPLVTGNGLYPVGITSALMSDGHKHATSICEPIRFKCPAGQVLRGIQATGLPDCSPAMAACSANTVTSPCGGVISITGVSLPANAGTVVNLNSGVCATPQYTCSNGNWVLSGGNNSTEHCTGASSPATACGPGYTGNYTQNVCSATSTFASSCTCTGIAAHNVSFTCGSQYSNAGSSYTLSCSQTCSSGTLNPQTCTGTNPCTCANTARYEFADCPAGQTRKASPTASDAHGIIPWPADPQKGGYRWNDVDAGTCGYSNPAYEYSNCECGGARYNQVEKSPSDYPAGNGGDNAIHPYCYAGIGTRNVEDPPGTIVLANVPWKNQVTKTTTNSSCSSTTSVVDEAQFSPAAYNWVSDAPPTAMGVTTIPTGAFQMGTGCTCQTYAAATFRANQVCYQTVGGGRYNLYRCGCRNY